jgi:hypothetical protein
MIYIITLTEWNATGYDSVDTMEHGRWHFTDDMLAMNTLLETLITKYKLTLSGPNTWEWGGEFKGLVLYLTHTEALNSVDVKKVTPPSFSWLEDAQEWYGVDK